MDNSDRGKKAAIDFIFLGIISVSTVAVYIDLNEKKNYGLCTVFI